MRRFTSVYINGTGHFLPGSAVDNEQMDRYIGSVSNQSSRIKRRILAENGIETRHYAINQDGGTEFSIVQMAAKASMTAIERAGISVRDLGMVATGTVGADLAVPGFANMLQGDLQAPPLETFSVNGICSAGISALKAAAETIESKEHAHALVTAAEFPSRLFKKSRFEQIKGGIDFNAHFLRWMLSDGAGSVVLSQKPSNKGLSLKLNWLHSKSFSGDYPVCMSIGGNQEGSRSYLDYATLREAEEDGAFFLRQDIRLLPSLFEVGFNEYLKLVREGSIHPMRTDHFLCHYSSQKFSGVIEDLMKKADVFIPTERWYSNLKKSGNTGSASIFIMLSEFLNDRIVKPGEKILLFVPESGRFSISFAELEVVEASSTTAVAAVPAEEILQREFPELFLGLSEVWHSYRSEVMRTPLVQKITGRTLTVEHYLRWMESWIPQVRQGTLWMRRAIECAPEELRHLTDLITTHANEEQFDFKVLFSDYQALGGKKDLESLVRSPGGEALNAFMFSMAERDPLALLGGIFIVEGTGQKIIPALLPLLKDQLPVGLKAFRFLEYHGENDQAHLERWATAVSLALAFDPGLKEKMIQSARNISKLYLMQWNDIL